MEGEFFIYNDKIGFSDRTLSSILFYDNQGHYITSKLSQGRGPNEVLGIDQITPITNNRFFIMDEQWNLFLLDSCFRKINQYRINWNSQKSLKQLLKNPQPEDTGLYEVEYTKNRLRQWGENYLPCENEYHKKYAYNSYICLEWGKEIQVIDWKNFEQTHEVLKNQSKKSNRGVHHYRLFFYETLYSHTVEESKQILKAKFNLDIEKGYIRTRKNNNIR